jgi:hypothetical protein
MAWITGAAASVITGVTLTDAACNVAQEIVDLYSNRTQSASASMTVKDRYWLARAVAWQAAWLAGQVAIEGRMGVSFAGAGGSTISIPDEATLVLAPLARRAINRLSWKRPRSVRAASVIETLPLYPGVVDTDDEGAADPRWVAL